MATQLQKLLCLGVLTTVKLGVSSFVLSEWLLFCGSDSYYNDQVSVFHRTCLILRSS